MKIKTSELIGDALDRAVTMAKGYSEFVNPNYSTDWAQGGPIIEREKIGVWWATHYVDDEGEEYGNHWYAEAAPVPVCEAGPTPLIAAMRCYVLSKLGDEVDIPDELNH